MNSPTLLWAEGVRYERVGQGKEQRQSPALEAVRITSGTSVPGLNSSHEFAALCGGQLLEGTNGSGDQINFFLSCALTFTDSGDHAL